MKIVQIGLASYYTDGMAYQDNQLAEQNVRDGHTVTYISNAQKYSDGKIVDVGYEDVVLPSGVRLIRLPYVRVFNALISEKVRKVSGLYDILCELKPDVIMCHGLCSLSTLDVIKYKKNNKNVKLYADTHANSKNSGQNWFSLYVLHKGLYRFINQKSLPHIDKYFYITSDCKQFAIKNYGVSESLMEFYPLGGKLPQKENYDSARKRIREELCLKKDELLFVHTGKLDAAKRTKELLQAFSEVRQLNAKLIIIGSIPNSMKDILFELIDADDRVEYLGWKSAEELTDYLCASDLYLQPGSESATMQNAVCANCPVLCYPHESYLNGYDYGNIIWAKTQDEIAECFEKIAHGKIDLGVLSKYSSKCACELLDYKRLAERLYT